MPGIIPSQGGFLPHWLPLTTHLEIVAGDDCKAADGRALLWTSPSWPNLAGATLTMVIGHNQPPLGEILPVTWSGAVSASPDSPSSIFLEVTSAQTGVFAAGMYDYTLQATLTSGDQVTVAVGKLTVQASPTTPPIFS
jgi:hypothetical protein